MVDQSDQKNHLERRVAMAALLGKYLGDTVVSFAHLESGRRAGIEQDAVRALRESSAEATKLLIDRLSLSRPLLALAGRLLSRLPKISPSDAAVAAESVVVRIGAELRGAEGMPAMSAFLAAYELRRVRILAKVAAHDEIEQPEDLVRFFRHTPTRKYLMESLRLLAHHLATLFPNSPPHRYLSHWCAKAEENLKDGAVIRSLCIYLNTELINWFELHIEYVVPNETEARLDVQFFLNVFDLGRFASTVATACLLSRHIAPKMLDLDFYALSALASRLAVRQPELEEAESLVAPIRAKGVRDLVRLRKLGKLVRNAVLFKAKTLIELQYGSMAHTVFSLGEWVGKTELTLRTAMRGGYSAFGITCVAQPEYAAEQYHTAESFLNALQLSRVQREALLTRLGSLKAGDPQKIRPSDITDALDVDLRRILTRHFGMFGRAFHYIDGAFPEIQPALDRLHEDYPQYERNVFIMMRFNQTQQHEQILRQVKGALRERGYIGLRADEKAYADELWTNVRAYMLGCSMGIAVFEK